jgi:hypothetical protein
LFSAANETNTLKDLIAGAAMKFEQVAVLEQAIGALSVQFEETCQIASGLSSIVATSHAVAGPASAHSDNTQAVLREISNMGALHESAWQRVHATLADIQQSLEHIAKATRDGTGLSGAALIPASADPFASILTSLAQHGQDSSLATRVIRPGASEEILPTGVAFCHGTPASRRDVQG